MHKFTAPLPLQQLNPCQAHRHALDLNFYIDNFIVQETRFPRFQIGFYPSRPESVANWYEVL